MSTEHEQRSAGRGKYHPFGDWKRSHARWRAPGWKQSLLLQNVLCLVFEKWRGSDGQRQKGKEIVQGSKAIPNSYSQILVFVPISTASKSVCACSPLLEELTKSGSRFGKAQGQLD